MDILTFTLEVIKATAWPLSAILIVILLKEPLAALLKQMKTLKYKDVEIDFGEKIDSVTQEASKELPEVPATTEVEDEKIKELAQLSPRGAVLEAWINVESAFKEAAQRHGFIDDKINPFQPGKFSSIIYQFQVSEHIGKGTIEIFQKLNRLRNEAVHLEEFSFDSKAAVEFIQLANRLIKIFEEA